MDAVMERKWRVFCEMCSWRVDDLATRAQAVRLGYTHTEEAHQDEYAFRVQAWIPSMSELRRRRIQQGLDQLEDLNPLEDN